MADVVICELLCYMQYYVDKCPKDNIVSSVSSFYTVAEIEAAKAVMADIVGDTEAVRRRAGSNKRKLDTEDILTMFENHDKSGAAAMPTFVAAKLKRLPTVSPSEVDVCALAANVTDLQSQVEKVSEAIVKLAEAQSGLTKAVESRDTSPSNILSALQTEITGQGHIASASSDQEVMSGSSATAGMVTVRSWAQRAAEAITAVQRPTQPDDDGFTTVSHRRLTVKRAMPTATGRKTGNSAIKTVPRPLVCFVGRLDINTTADSLAEFLADSGIVGAKCTKLQAKDGRTFKTAAFRVSCPVEYRELFYNEFNWPEGADLRDWYDKPR